MSEKAENMQEPNWDEAPKLATHWGPETDVWRECWYFIAEPVIAIVERDGFIYEARAIDQQDREERLPMLIPRPADPAAEDRRHEQVGQVADDLLPSGVPVVVDGAMGNEDLRRAIEGTLFDLSDVEGYAPGVVDMLKAHLRRLLEIETARAGAVHVAFIDDEEQER